MPNLAQRMETPGLVLEDALTLRRRVPRRYRCGAAIFHPKHNDIYEPMGYCRKRHMHAGKHEIRTRWQRFREACEL